MKRTGMTVLLSMVAIVVLLTGVFACSSPATPTAAPKATTAPTATTPAPTTPAQVTRLSLFGVSTTSSMYPGLLALAEAVRSSSPNIQITVIEGVGGAVGWQGVQDGKYDLTVGSTEQSYLIYTGGAPWTKNVDVRPILPISNAYYHFVAAADSGINKLEDLNGKKFFPGETGQATAIAVMALLDRLGIKPSYVTGTYADGLEKFKKGDIPAFQSSGNLPFAMITEAALSKPVKFLGFTPEQLKTTMAASPVLAPVTIPAGTYKGQDYDVPTLGFSSGILTLKGKVSDDVVYQIVKGWSTGFTKFVVPVYHDVAKVNPLQWIVDVYRVPMHAGTIRALREAKMTIPDYLIPPEAK